MKSVLFIHRSVGLFLLQDGHVRKLLQEKNIPFALDDYDQNLDILTTYDGKTEKPGFTFPQNDTTPVSYARIFAEGAASEFKPIQDLAFTYGTVVIKSCYPNNNIKSDAQLEDIKNYYRSIAAFFSSRPDKQLVILTSPPQTPLRTNLSRAKRARQLATWLSEADFASNVSVLNFYDLLADKKWDWLKRSYRRKLPVDSHPNARADRDIAPVFVDFINQI